MVRRNRRYVAPQSMCKMQCSSHCFFIKMAIRRQKAAKKRAQSVPGMGASTRFQASQPVTLAPPKRSFQRGMTSRL